MLYFVCFFEQYKDSFFVVVCEVQEIGSGLGEMLVWKFDDISVDFGKVLCDLICYELGNELLEGFVYFEYCWLVEGSEYLGCVFICYSFNDCLCEFGGYIGYEICFSVWCKGYGILILWLVLEWVCELGIDLVLVICDVDNFGLCGVIEVNGGELEGEFEVFQYYDQFIWWYWIW